MRKLLAVLVLMVSLVLLVGCQANNDLQTRIEELEARLDYYENNFEQDVHDATAYDLYKMRNELIRDLNGALELYEEVLDQWENDIEDYTETEVFDTFRELETKIQNLENKITLLQNRIKELEEIVYNPNILLNEPITLTVDDIKATVSFLNGKVTQIEVCKLSTNQCEIELNEGQDYDIYTQNDMRWIIDELYSFIETVRQTEDYFN